MQTVYVLMEDSCHCEGEANIQVPYGVYKFESVALAKIDQLKASTGNKFSKFFIEEVTYFD